MSDCDKDLNHAFYVFACFGTRQLSSEMDGAKWVKMLRDARIIDLAFTSSDADIIFAKVKTKGARRIRYDQFVRGLEYVAQRKNVDTQYVINLVCGACPTTNNATVPDYVAYHDDKTLYTGVYAKGGPQMVDKARSGSGSFLTTLCDRSPADVRGVKYEYAVLRR